MKITLAKGGTEERTEDLNEITIPDLWHIASGLPPEDRDKVLECWYKAHDLIRALKHIEKSQ